MKRLAFLAVVACLCGCALAGTGRADSISIDPTGGGGANPANVLLASSFAFLPGNALAIGGGNLTSASIGKDIPILYQAILGSINTVGANSAALGSNNGNITILPGGGGSNNTGVQFIITAQFTEKLTGVSAGGMLTFAPDLAAGTNQVKIYAQPSSNASINDANSTNEYPGSGATQILSGQLSPANFSSSFNVAQTTDPRSGGTAVPLNQHAGGSGSYPGINSIAGLGLGGFTVTVDSSNPAYFLTPTPVALNFNSVSSSLPFTGVDPALKMFNGTTPNIGAVNGVSGPDALYQWQGNNSFTTTAAPEPASLTLLGVGAVGLLGYGRRKRKRAAA
jgi:hypothetical protein